MKKAILSVAIVALIGAAFWGGTAYAKAGSDNTAATAGVPGDGARTGGPMADLTDEERAEIESMTDEERREFFAEQMGGNMPANGAMPGGNMGSMGGLIDGEVIEVAPDSITVSVGDAGSSQTFYTDTDTVIAYAEGAGELAAGSVVMVSGQPEPDGVTNATLVVVK
jgi:hypothetical protein